MIPVDAFPRLTSLNHRITSPVSRDYNCVAEHDTPEDVAGGCYGEIMQFMKRSIASGFGLPTER